MKIFHLLVTTHMNNDQDVERRPKCGVKPSQEERIAPARHPWCRKPLCWDSGWSFVLLLVSCIYKPTLGRFIGQTSRQICTLVPFLGGWWDLRQICSQQDGNWRKRSGMVDFTIYSSFASSPHQVVLMIHCGSRGFGHQVATDALVSMEKAMKRDNIEVGENLNGISIFT